MYTMLRHRLAAARGGEKKIPRRDQNIFLSLRPVGEAAGKHGTHGLEGSIGGSVGRLGSGSGLLGRGGESRVISLSMASREWRDIGHRQRGRGTARAGRGACGQAHKQPRLGDEFISDK